MDKLSEEDIVESVRGRLFLRRRKRNQKERTKKKCGFKHTFGDRRRIEAAYSGSFSVQ